MSRGQPGTIHRNVLTDFNKTSQGKVYEKDIKDIFSMMVICLDLKPAKTSLLKSALVKQYSYGFYLEHALAAMSRLKLKVELNHTTTTISYCIKKDLALELVKRFFEAKLLHSPAERTRSTMKPTLLLQPTPKGVAILSSFCTTIGLRTKQLPPILSSSFDTMELFTFDRAHLTDKIIYSEYLLYMLFNKLCSVRPNVWSSKNPPEKYARRLRTEHDETSGDFIFDEAAVQLSDGFKALASKNGNSASDEKTSSPDDPKNNKEFLSPFHHRYFTNPESDSHVQYYVSSSGVRIFEDKVFYVGDQSVKVKYCVSGKAIYQWLFDCTDILASKDCIEIADLFIKANLISPLMLQPSQAHSKFAPERNHFYLLTKLGHKVGHWDRDKETSEIDHQDIFSEEIDVFFESKHPIINSPSSDDLGLDDVLKDNGLRYLFKKHLENEFCCENLDAYLRLAYFEKRIKVLGKALKHKNKNSQSMKDKISKLADQCLSTAYHIFFTYLSYESPFVLNIDYNLRIDINDIMINTKEEKRTPNEDTHQDEELFFTKEVEKNPEPTKFQPDRCKTDSIVPQVIIDSRPPQTQKLVYTPIDSLSTPIERSIRKTLMTLAKISKCFSAVSNDIYKLMESDSFPKFMNSDLFREATLTIEFKKAHTTEVQ